MFLTSLPTPLAYPSWPGPIHGLYICNWWWLQRHVKIVISNGDFRTLHLIKDGWETLSFVGWGRYAAEAVASDVSYARFMYDKFWSKGGVAELQG